MKNTKFLKKSGLKVTIPRLAILEILQQSDVHHVSAEDIFRALVERDLDIGIATVYRTLNQFEQAGIVERHYFEEEKSFYELAPPSHHDHLICVKCGKVVEFEDDIIESRQHAIAKQHRLRLTSHRMYLFAECVPSCDTK